MTLLSKFAIQASASVLQNPLRRHEATKTPHMTYRSGSVGCTSFRIRWFTYLAADNVVSVNISDATLRNVGSVWALSQAKYLSDCQRSSDTVRINLVTLSELAGPLTQAQKASCAESGRNSPRSIRAFS
jgi:hypothetical protein